MTLKIQWQEQGLHLKVEQDGSTTQFMQLDQIFGDERFDDSEYWLLDCRGIKGISNYGDQEELELQFISTRIAMGYKPNLNVAIVSNENNFQTEIRSYLKKFEDYKPTWKIRLFDQIASARNWLKDR